MGVTSGSSIFSQPRISREMFVDVLEAAGSFPSALWNGTPRGREKQIAGDLYDLIVERGQDPAFWLAICAEEHTFGTNRNSVLWRHDTRSWTNARTVRDPALQGTYEIITDATRRSSYVKYASVIDSLRDGLYRVSDPHFVYVQEGRESIGRVIERWAPEGDWSRYINVTVERINRWAARQGDAWPTDRMIALLRRRGHEVHDMRGKLPVNPNPAHRYDTMPLDDVKFIVHHWTGDRFTRETLRTITGTDYGSGDITPAMSVADEIDLLKWYANYHISRDGHTWGGIAYGVMVFPSGRIYVNWNIGTFTYHAYQGANRQSYATCCPNANAAQPSPAQLAALRDVWDVLCCHTPEIPARRGQLLGHSEAKILDSRNATDCPGTFLPHVRNFRDQRDDIPVLKEPVSHEQRCFAEVEFCIHLGFKGYWERLEQKGEAWTSLGYPRSPEFQVSLDGHQRIVQLFERGALIFEPEYPPPWDIHHATGDQYIEIMRQTGKL